ncbi:MAG: TonB-dependent receptor [Gammaproteobacteria bacterium]|nr:TonB-dependent receptor [Gammaproteobacteria bacterium]
MKRKSMPAGRLLGVMLSGVAALALSTEAWSAVEEIIVTTRKREENLQQVPVAVSAINAETIARRGITDAADVARINASVIFDQGFSAQDTRITIRGLAPTRGRQNVAVLVDGIDIANQAIQTNGGGLLITPRLFDMERIEVVKGPQNALYGRTAFAGAINYITKKPGDEFAGRVATDIGSDGQLELRGSLSGPLAGDTVLGGLNVATWNSDGFYENSITGGEVGGTDGSAVAGTLVWKPNDRLSATFRSEYLDDDIEQAPYFAILPTTPADIPLSARTDPDGPGPLLPAINPNFTQILSVRGTLPGGDGQVVTLSEDPRTGSDYPGVTREIWRNTLNLQYDFGSITLVSLTHFADSDVFSFEDARREGSISDPARTVGAEFWADDETTLFSQELRLQSNGDNIVDWTVGALLWQEDTDFTDGSVNCIQNAAPPFLPGLSCAPTIASYTTGSGGNRFEDPWDRDTDHWSVYALVDWEFLDGWRIIGEGRYSDESVEVTGPDRADPDGAGPLCSQPRAVDTRNVAGNCFSFPAVIAPAFGSLSDTVDDEFFAPKITLQWDATEDMMYYLSWAKGTKPKGISIVGALTGYDVAASRFDSEEVDVYEIGGKTAWLDRSLTANFAAFFQDFSDKLVSSQKQDPNTGLLFAAPVNASSAEVWGVELDFAWRVTDHLTLTASYTWLDTEYEDFTQLSKGPSPIADAGNCVIVDDPGSPGPGNDDDFCELDLSGNQLEFAPEHAAVAAVNYTRPLVGATDWFVEASGEYQDDRYISAFNTTSFDSYTTVDLRAGVTNEQWEISAYVDNVFDDDTIRSAFQNTYNQGITVFGGSFSPFGLPSTFVLPSNLTPILPDERQYGLRVAYNFGAPD